MLDQQTIKEMAQRLHYAEKHRQQMGQISLQYPQITIDDAYAIQKSWLELKLAEGQKIKGHKIGLTSRAMQQASQINEPDYGTLLDEMFFQHKADIPATKFIAPMVEVELAFVLNKTLQGEELTIDQVFAATEYIVPAIEIIDARCHRIDPLNKRPRKVMDTISDNAANAGVVLGEHKIQPDDIDLRWVGALLYKNGTIEETGISAGVLDHPANGIIWLARKFARHGVALEAGQVILSGSFTRPVAASQGDEFVVDYADLGSVNCQFV